MAATYLRFQVAMRRFLFLLLLLLALPNKSFGQEQAFPEYAMKAAFIYNFTLFTQWPELPNNTLQICTFRAQQIKDELELYAATKKPHQANLVIAKIDKSDDIRLCQAVFLSEEDLPQAPAVLVAAKEKPLLVITDTSDLINKGAMIAIKIENQRMVFEINLTAAKQAKLHLSSKLLSLAKKIHEK